jgi:hypothetical protein
MIDEAVPNAVGHGPLIDLRPRADEAGQASDRIFVAY